MAGRVPTWESDLNADKGAWERSASVYRSAPSSAEPGRYVLYGSHACPWATRSKMLLQMLGLEEAIATVDCDPLFGVIDEETQRTGWVFSDEFPEPLYKLRSLRELYLLGNPQHDSKSTTPALWDRQDKCVLHNESKELILILHDSFRSLAKHPEVDLFPEHLRTAIDDFYEAHYAPLFDGVYRAGFATKQKVLDDQLDSMFEALDQLEVRLSKQRWALGERFTFADLALFPTLWRFDFVYNIHFKCSRRRIVDYPALREYVKEMYSWPVIRATNSVELTRRHYYCSHYTINPHRLVAKVDLSWMDMPHERGHLAQQSPHWFMTSD